MITKRIISALLAASMALGSTALTASAEKAPIVKKQSSADSSFTAAGKIKFGSKFSYRVNPDGNTVTLIEFTDKAIASETLRIPSKLDGMEVTVMGEDLRSSFYTYYKQIKVLDIPKTVKKIEDECLPWYQTDLNYTPLFYPDHITITCCKKTAAETFAARHNYKYKIKDADKNYVHAVRMVKSVAVSSRMVKFRWSKVKNVDGYRVYRLKNNKWKKIADVAAGTTFYKDYGCDKNGFNYYTVRAFRKSGGKTCWSKKSTIKIIKCMSRDKTPYVSDMKVSDDGRGVGFTVKGSGKEMVYTYVDVQDPETKQWSKPVISYIYNGNYDFNIKDFTFNIDGRDYTDEFVEGNTYNIRVRYGVIVGDSAIPYDNGYMICMDHVHYGKPTVRSVTF